ncbi:MAG: shikimate kinase [Actinomycetota bacterium]
MGHIWLIGMMGSGKTSVGKKVADRLGVPFIDADAEVVTATGRSIENLFSESEAAFRRAERVAIARIATLEDRVVATGGGVVLDAANVVAMKSTGTTVLLDADARTLSARLSDTDDRPLLNGGRDIATIAADRASAYAASADVVVDTSDRDIDEVVEAVARCVSM